MALEDKPEYIRLKSHYRGYFIEEFEEDYYNYRAVIRLINSYFKNPSPRKAHDIYNRLIILHRVFNKHYINRELLNTCDTVLKQDFLKFLLNEFFKHKYGMEQSRRRWKKDLDFLKKCDIMCRI